MDSPAIFSDADYKVSFITAETHRSFRFSVSVRQDLLGIEQCLESAWELKKKNKGDDADAAETNRPLISCDSATSAEIDAPTSLVG